MKSQRKDIDIVCGYEAGCLGYVPCRELTKSGINCKILAPSTMAVQKGGKKQKNDFRDALDIARCLASGSYKAVNVPDICRTIEKVDHQNDRKLTTPILT